MKAIKLLLLGFFILTMAGCSDHGHSHDDNSQHSTPNKHDSID
jgi:hypothetical protein